MGTKSFQRAFAGTRYRQPDRLRSSFFDFRLFSQPRFNGTVYHSQCCRYLDSQLFLKQKPKKVISIGSPLPDALKAAHHSAFALFRPDCR